MTKKKLILIICGSALGIIIMACIIFGCWIKGITTSLESDVGVCLNSRAEMDIILCKDENEYNLWLSKLLIIDRKIPHEKASKICSYALVSRENFTKDDFQTVKENLYDTIMYISNPVQEGIYIFLDKEDNSFAAFYLKYNRNLKKKLGSCMQAISLEDCWITSEISLE